jgi:arylsulfatase I/J
MTNGTEPGALPEKGGVGRRNVLLGGGASLAASAAAGSLLSAATSRPATAAPPGPPNIVYIVADDLGWQDVGFRGSDIKTPNLDRLAESGAELEEFYVQPYCSPTRAALLTGRYPLRYGLQTAAIPSGARYGLPTDEFLLSQALRGSGYETVLVGKWHLGHAKPEYWPCQRGFDHFYGPLVGEIDHFTHEAHGVTDWYRDNRRIMEKGYDTTLFGDESVRVIDAHDRAKPLFLYLAFTAPHTPYQAPEEYLARYPDIADPNRRAYAAMISAMDDQIGRVVAALEEKGMRGNTLIVFHSDNGGTRSAKFTGESAVKGELPPSNGLYRGGKGTLYEGGTLVGAVFNWPGRIKPGRVQGLLHAVDICPTLVGLAGARFAGTKPLDGMDVWATISEGAPSPRNEIVYNVDPLMGAVREGAQKLIWVGMLPSSFELFDLGEDPYEKANLAEANPEQVKALQSRIAALAREMVEPLILVDVLGLVLSTAPSTPAEYFVDS